MEKPIGALDCDDSMTEFAVHMLQWVNQTEGTDYSVDQLTHHDLAKSFGGSREQWTERIRAHAHYERQVPARPARGLVAALGKLSTHYELVVITARPTDELDIVEAFVEEHASEYVSDIIGRDVEHDLYDKGEMMEYVNAEFIVDDHHVHVDSAIQRGRRGVLFGTLPKTLAYKDHYPHAPTWKDVPPHVITE